MPFKIIIFNLITIQIFLLIPLYQDKVWHLSLFSEKPFLGVSAKLKILFKPA